MKLPDIAVVGGGLVGRLLAGSRRNRCLYAPEIDLRHMMRLLHPCHSVYVVPRAEGRLVVGATA